ncbi:MAG: CCA tRNA nucleotidyltransferase [Nitrospiria bacterium]
MKSQGNSRTKPLYEQVIQIVQTLRNAGYKAYFAGGAVRDQIRGIIPTDYDIATSAKPNEVLALFPQAIPVGVAFGVVLVPLSKSYPKGKRDQVEIATFRSDGFYRDGRHPESVLFSEEKEDALRRDFTINGMFFDPLENKLIDYVGGKEDLKARVIRTIGDPEHRFKEDSLRIIRAVRFAAQFSFQIESRTLEMIGRMAESIRNVSWERIRDELGKIITGPDPVRGLNLLEESGILKVILPELIPLNESSLLHKTIACFNHIKGPSLELAFAILLHRIEDSHLINSICDRLKLSRAQSDKVKSMIGDLPKFTENRNKGEAQSKRFVRQSYFEDLLELYRVDSLASGETLMEWEYWVQKLQSFKPEDLFPPVLLSGNDLIKMGYHPGPLFKKMLYNLEDLQLEGKIKTLEEAKEQIIKGFSVKNDDPKIKI